MKTPDEIKKGLECAMPRSCNGHKCSTCPNATYSLHELLKGDLIKDTFDYITQLEQRLAQAERERDALMYDFPRGFACHTCKHETTDCNDFPCNDCVEASRGVHWVRWEWRGVCEENSKEENNG